MEITRTANWEPAYIDKDGNMWRMENFTEAEAEAASKTLINCTGCIDCVDCVDCHDCESSSHSKSCYHSVGLRYCVACIGCANDTYVESDIQRDEAYIKQQLAL